MDAAGIVVGRRAVIEDGECAILHGDIQPLLLCALSVTQRSHSEGAHVAISPYIHGTDATHVAFLAQGRAPFGQGAILVPWRRLLNLSSGLPQKPVNNVRYRCAKYKTAPPSPGAPLPRNIAPCEDVAMTVFTIGYEGLSIDSFLSLLTQHGIDTIIDVREYPVSRKPGFSKKSLASALHLSGRQYVHMGELGCPKLIRDRYRDDGNWKRYTVSFLEYLQTQTPAVLALWERTQLSRCALLCFEADHNFCHRSMVANAVRAYCGANVRHVETARAKRGAPALPQLAFS